LTLRAGEAAKRERRVPNSAIPTIFLHPNPTIFIRPNPTTTIFENKARPHGELFENEA
jgi:hypothetical protein